MNLVVCVVESVNLVMCVVEGVTLVACAIEGVTVCGRCDWVCVWEKVRWRTPAFVFSLCH